MPQTITVRSFYQDPDTPPEASNASKVRDPGLRKLLWKMFFPVKTLPQLKTVLNDIEHLPPSTGVLITKAIEAFSVDVNQRSRELTLIFRGTLESKRRLNQPIVWALREWVSLHGEVAYAQATSEKKIYGMDPKDAALEILLFIHTKLSKREPVPDKSQSAGYRGGQRRVGIGRVSTCR